MKRFEIAVYGAAGHTGRMVSAEAQRRGASVRSVGRRQPLDPSAEDLLQWRTASCDDADSLDHALEGVDAVINCAGPFIETAPALIEAALRAGVHYFDITAEQRSARQSLAT